MPRSAVGAKWHSPFQLGPLDGRSVGSYTGLVASYSGKRIASLLTGALLLVSASELNAADAGATGGASGTGGTAPVERPQDDEERVEAAEHDQEEASEERAGEAVEAEPAHPVEVPPEDPQPLHAVPPPPEVGPADGPSRGDFLRRLRTTAEDIERGKASEPTQLHTHGDVSVLSNVPATTASEPATPNDVPSATPPAPAEPVAAPSAEVLPASAETTLRDSPPVALKEDSTPWHWLWILGGVATVLLVPIAMLLTRATRSS